MFLEWYAYHIMIDAAIYKSEIVYNKYLYDALYVFVEIPI